MFDNEAEQKRWEIEQAWKQREEERKIIEEWQQAAKKATEEKLKKRNDMAGVY